MGHNILIVNFGATSTKIAVYDGNEEIFFNPISHSKEELSQYPSAKEQKTYRKAKILETLEDNNIDITTIDAVGTRAGILSPVNPGAYTVNQDMMDYQANYTTFDHITLIGTTLAYELAKEAGPDVNAYVYDSESVDQLSDIARITGSKYIEKSSLGHTLNILAATRRAGEDLSVDLKNTNFIVAHIGSGNTISAIKNFEIIDMVGDDEGPFASERAGGLPVRAVTDLSYKVDKNDISTYFRSEGGLYSYLGTNDGREIEDRINGGDAYAALVYEALAYQVAKACGELAVPLNGQVEKIIVTGGLAYSDMLVNWIEKWTSHIAPLHVYPGENEMETLATGINRVLNGEEESQNYQLEK